MFNCKTRISSLALQFAVVLIAMVVGVHILNPTSDATSESSINKAPEAKRKKQEFVPGEILVRYRSAKVAKLEANRRMLQSVEGDGINVQVESFEGADIVDGLRIMRVAPNEMSRAMAALRTKAEVLYAEPNYVLQPDLSPNDPRFSELYGLTKIGATESWDVNTGSTSIVVGVVDEGIDLNHQDLEANIWTNPLPGSVPGIIGDVHGYNFFNNSGTIPPDQHGTHVAGTIGAVGNNGIGIVGVNWNIGLMSLKFLGPGGGSTSDSIRAFNYAKTMRDLWVSSGGSRGANIRVLNNSYGGAGFSQAAEDAIHALNQSGILFVAAAGNNGRDTDLQPYYPAGYNSPNVISVAATNSTDSLASFSNFGLYSVDLGAPGVSILSTTPGNTYSLFSGTSMASPHVAGGAALICAADPSVTVQKAKSLLLLNGDLVESLGNKTLLGRRLNLAKSLQALAENDLNPPGTVTDLHITSQNGRTINVAWTASGDDGAVGQASLFEVSFTDADSGVVIPLKNIVPLPSGSHHTFQATIPYRHTNGVVTINEFDNVGNQGAPASVNVTLDLLASDPYVTSLNPPSSLSTGGTPLGLTFDDRYLENRPLPFTFPFFGETFNSVTVSTNGSLYFSAPPKRANGDADDIPSSTLNLARFKMIAGLWDDLDLSTSQRADADVYFVQLDANRVVFRWQGVPCNYDGFSCLGGDAVNFEIELQSNGNILARYGNGNTGLFPVVGIAGGEPDAYVINSHTSEQSATSLTNAQTVSFLSRAATTGFSLAAAPITVGSGQTLTATWTAPNGRPANDWIGLYKLGNPETSFIAWQYTGGTVSGNAQFTAPSQAGQYEFRYFTSNTYNKVATSNPVTVTGPAGTFSLNATPTTATPGQTLIAIWTAPAGRPANDWVGLFKVGESETSFITWQYTGGTQSGNANFSAPIQAGQYEFRYFTNNSYNRVATSNSVTVNLAETFTISGSPSTVLAGDSLIASWTAPNGRPANDWIGFYRVGAQDTSFLAWQYTGGSPAGTRNFDAPAQPGEYEFRYFTNNSYTKVATSNIVSVIVGSFTVNASPSSASPGQSLTVNWTAPNGRPVRDWIGLYRVGDRDSSFISWQYTGGNSFGSTSFTAPNQSGQYEFRYFTNDSFIRAATSNSVTVIP